MVVTGKRLDTNGQYFNMQVSLFISFFSLETSWSRLIDKAYVI